MQSASAKEIHLTFISSVPAHDTMRHPRDTLDSIGCQRSSGRSMGP